MDAQKITMQVNNRKFIIDQKDKQKVQIVYENKSRVVSINELPEKYTKYMVYIQNVIKTLNKNIPLVTIINKQGLFQIMSDQITYQAFYENMNLQLEGTIHSSTYSSKPILSSH